MSAVDHEPHIASIENSAATLFQNEWQIYRKMVDCNYLFHREVYDRLHRILIEEAPLGFSFLDVACGDASASAAALKKTAVGRYHGIDLCRAALDIAAGSLAALTCPVALREGDFPETLRGWREPVDVVWIGLSLHHFHAPEKLALMREVHRIIRPGGLFLIYENASPDGEDRATWLRRYDTQKPSWKEYTPAEWDTMQLHVHASDFPETNATWHGLGRKAGFGEVQEVFVAPSNLFRMYLFRA